MPPCDYRQIGDLLLVKSTSDCKPYTDKHAIPTAKGIAELAFENIATKNFADLGELYAVMLKVGWSILFCPSLVSGDDPEDGDELVEADVYEFATSDCKAAFYLLMQVFYDKGCDAFATGDGDIALTFQMGGKAIHASVAGKQIVIGTRPVVKTSASGRKIRGTPHRVVLQRHFYQSPLHKGHPNVYAVAQNACEP
tara:strand:+ start:379 stop:966 length:588 start_codon:yes stop_codon:yes gene_type:complete